MNRKSQKVWLAAAASLVACTSLLSAADDAQMRNLENRVSALEHRKSANGMINPNGRPQVKDGCDLFVTADFLYWKAVEDNLIYVLENEHGVSFANDSDVRDPHGDWNCGFRIGVGYNTPHDGWDLYANWTRIHNHGHGEEHADEGGTLFPTWLNAYTNSSSNPTCTKAKADWKLRVNLIDLELGREFFTSKWLTLRPFMGLRSGWIHQKLDIDYDNATYVVVQSMQGDVDIDLKNNFWGLGPRGGLNTQWGLGGGWSIYGDMAVSALFGHFKFDEDQDFKNLLNVKKEQLDAERHKQSGKFILDLALGLRWDHMFDDDRFHLGVQAGYEVHWLPGQNQLFRFVDDTAQGSISTGYGDLTLQGWTLSARFDF